MVDQVYLHPIIFAPLHDFHKICTLLSARINSSPCSEIKNRAEAKIVCIEEKIKTLKGMKKALVELSWACSGSGPISECPILESLEG
jgi:MerR family mercuric resistance operon transcriptional regulator